ncbi:apolipoprotein D [Parasteatoda tepidariorum]|uniref:apolipoprotein D n=1 Tax=Parasteatoda tepidariorum TaxID=114398 RepID=UPI00077FDB89|nr:apolipoprotein D [Parasteatoda tepidariorum]
MQSLGVFAFVLCIVAGCHGNTFKLGACPRVVVMNNLDFDQFLGEWYVVQRFNPMATCTKILYNKTSDDSYTISEKSRPLGLNFNFHYQFIKPRHLNFLRNDTTSIFRAERDIAHFTLSTFGVIDTDYNNYAVVWGCDPVLFGSIQNVDILSRTPTPQTNLIKSVKETLKNLSIDYHPMDNVDQTRCEDSNSNSDGSSTDGDRNTNNIIAG